jgi:hypothetical protein
MIYKIATKINEKINTKCNIYFPQRKKIGANLCVRLYVLKKNHIIDLFCRFCLLYNRLECFVIV